MLLPIGLEILELKLGDHHYSRNGRDYVYAALCSLVAKNGQANNLKKIIIDSEAEGSQFGYCGECDEACQNQRQREMRTNISVGEKERIINLMPPNIELRFVPDPSWREPYRIRKVAYTAGRKGGESWQRVLRPR